MAFDKLVSFAWGGWTTTWPTELLAIIWLLWLTSWIGASFWQGQTRKHVLTLQSTRYRLPILIGGILFTPWTAELLRETPLFNWGEAGVYVWTLVTLAGITFTWWARIHLGRF